jgi:hypothetical protein
VNSGLKTTSARGRVVSAAGNHDGISGRDQRQRSASVFSER